ncbi:MAG TPA: glycosyltransferase [Patescibacteria group bacterium]|nr:glycosyltransferase [Patescibacteria group bacterium]
MTRLSQDSGKPRIVFVLPALTAGGAERVLITLMNGLDPEKFDRYFVTVSESGPLRSLINPAIPFFALSPNGRVSRNLFKLYARLRALGPDIVVSTMTHMNFGVLLLRPFFPRTKFVVREAVTPSYFSDKNAVQRFLIFAGWRGLYNRATLVISPAQKILDELGSLGIRFKNHLVLPNPVDTDLIRGSGADARRDGVYFVCAGRLDSQKGFDRLIESLPKMPSNAGWYIEIIGEGHQRAELEALIAKHRLSDCVKLTGYISNPWPKIAAADAFLMPSRHEGLPNVVLEALDCGTPVIATAESGGIAEIASKATPASVTIVGTMDEFIAAMAGVAPREDEKMCASLLPDEYRRANVIAKFTQLLMQAGNEP